MKHFTRGLSSTLLLVLLWLNLHCAHSSPKGDPQKTTHNRLTVKAPKLQSSKTTDADLTIIPLVAKAKPLPDSVITLPLTFSMESAIEQIERIAPKKIQQDWQEFVVKGAKVEAKFHAVRDRVKLSFKNGFLITRHTINYHARFRVRIKNPLIKKKWIWITKGSDWGSPQKPHRLTVTLRTHIGVKDNWDITADTDIKEIRHSTPDTKDKICVGKTFRFCLSSSSLVSSIHGQIEKALRPQLQKTIDAFDRNIHDLIKLRAFLKMFWKGIQCPLDLENNLQPKCDPEPLSGPHLLLQPKALHMGEIDGNKRELSLTIGLTCRPKVVLSTKPKRKKETLPNREPLPKIQGFHLLIDAELNFRELSKILQKNLRGKQFPKKGKQKILVQSAEIIGFQAGNGEENTKEQKPRLVIRLELGGVLPALVYLTGYLSHDKDQAIITLADLDYSVETQNVFVQMMDDINHEAFRQEIAKYAHWDLNRILAPMEKKIQKVLKQKRGTGLVIGGDISSLAPIGFGATKEAILFRILLKGQLEAELIPTR